jgi:hypothetical protein
MSAHTTSRKLLINLLMLMIAFWAEAGLALVDGDQAMQCSMSAHEMQAMGDMPCCPGEEMLAPAMAHERPPCCSVSSTPDRPFAVEVGSKQVKSQHLDAVAGLQGAAVAPIAQSHRDRFQADAPNFVRPVLELKTDLRI